MVEQVAAGAEQQQHMVLGHQDNKYSDMSVISVGSPPHEKMTMMEDEEGAPCEVSDSDILLDESNPASVLYWWQQYLILSRSPSPTAGKSPERCLQFPKQLQLCPAALMYLIDNVKQLSESQRPSKICLWSSATSGSGDHGVENVIPQEEQQGLYQLTLQLMELCKNSLRSLDLRPAEGGSSLGGSLDMHRAAFQSLKEFKYLNELHVDMDGLPDNGPNQGDEDLEEDEDEDMDEDTSQTREDQGIVNEQEEVELDQNGLFWTPLTQALAKPGCQIRALSIHNANDLDFLEPALREYTGLKKLDLVNCSNYDDFDTLHTALTTTPSRLQRLSLQGMGLHVSELGSVVSLVNHQRELTTLDLSFNAYLLETTNEEGDYAHDAEIIDPFVQAISNHPTLQSLNLDNTRLHADTLMSILNAISNLDAPSKNLQELIFCDQSFVYFIGIEEGGWVACIPHMKNLRKLYGLQRLFQRQDEWQAKVVPALRKNTTLEELHHSSNQRVYPLDPETCRILQRNKMLRLTQKFRKTQGTPSLSVWPKMLEQLASPKTEASALYSFLCTKSAELQKSSPAGSATPSARGLKRPPMDQLMACDAME